MTDTLHGEKSSSEEDGVRSGVTRDFKQGGQKGIRGTFIWVVPRQEGEIANETQEAELNL